MPLKLLCITRTYGELVPGWFSDRDRPWLRDLLLQVEALAGQPIGILERRFRDSDPDPRAGARLAAARHGILWLLRRQRRAVDFGALRHELFLAAASGVDPNELLAQVATRRGLDPEALRAGLFADLPHARTVVWPSPMLELSRLSLALNLAIAKGVVRQAEAAELHVAGASAAVLRTAWLHGTYFTVVGQGGGGMRLRWAHGGAGVAARRGLMALLPVLPWARRFELRVRCRIRGETGLFVLTATDPILPGPEPRRFDSGLERRFALDVLAAGADWQVLREPAPVVVGGVLAFPDFLLQRRQTGSQWLLEIAGLRDRAALHRKLAILEVVPQLFLCMPRALIPEPYRGHPRLIAVHRRIDAAEVLARLRVHEATAGSQDMEASSS